MMNNGCDSSCLLVRSVCRMKWYYDVEVVVQRMGMLRDWNGEWVWGWSEDV